MDAFLQGRIRWHQIAQVNEAALDRYEPSADSTVDDIIGEVAAARVTERGSRADDKASEAAMEDRKKAGYF